MFSSPLSRTSSLLLPVPPNPAQLPPWRTNSKLILKTSVDVSLGKTPPSESDHTRRAFSEPFIFLILACSTLCYCLFTCLHPRLACGPCEGRACLLYCWLAGCLEHRLSMKTGCAEGVEGNALGVKVPRRLGPAWERSEGEKEGEGRDLGRHQASVLSFTTSLLPRLSSLSPWAPSSYTLTTVSVFQVFNGYFVHFFAPNNLDPIPKNILFVIDVSGSMWGIKMKQVSIPLFAVVRGAPRLPWSPSEHGSHSMHLSHRTCLGPLGPL